MTKDMTMGSPLRMILLFSVPVLLGNIFQQFYNMVDTIIVGQYLGEDALAAVGSTGCLMFLVLGFANGIAQGFGVMVSHAFGAKDFKLLKHYVALSLILTAIVSLLLTIPTVAASRQFLILMKTPDNILGLADSYIKVIFAGILLTMSYNVAAGILRGIGDSKTPLYFLILCSILNVILDLISVIGLNMGVAGVAVATVGSQAISAVICIIVMFRKYPDLMPKRHTLRPDMPVSLKIFGMGAQMALQSLFLSVGMMVITRVINGYGSNVVAAFTVGSNVQNLAVMLFSNFSFGFSVYVGQNFGAKNAERIKLGVRQIFLLVGGLSFFAGVLTLIFAEPLVSLYVKPNETEVIAYSLEFIRIQAWFFPFLGWIWLYNSTVKGMGKINISMVSSVVELCSKIGLSLLLPIWIGTTGIWFAAPIGYILGIIPLLIYYYSGRWKKLLTVPAAEPAKA